MPEKNNQELLMDLQQLKQEKNALKTLCNHKAAENEKLSERLRSFEWMFKKKQTAAMDYVPDYGDLSLLNKDGLIKKSIQKDQLQDIVSEYLDLLETSAAIYEKNGDYAMGIFSSGWCQMMDAASRRLCNTDDNRMALAGGDWLCHDSCWNDASLRSMNEGKPAEVACHGGLHIYAVPVRANKQIIGAINFGFGSPPKDDAELEKLSEKYKIPLKELREHSRAYKDRPQFIIDYAKQRIQNSAKYLGYLVERKIADDRLLEIKERYRIISETTSDFTFSCIIEKNRYVIDWIAGAVKKVTGYSVDDIKTNTCWRFMVHPDDDPIFVKHVLSLKPGEESACELRILGPNNTVRWLAVNTICLVDEEKNKRKIYGGCEDITERKRVELLLQEGNEEIATQNEELNQANLELNAAKEIAEKSEEKLKSIFRVAPTGIGVVKNRTFVEVNPKVCEMTGYRHEELLGQSARILYPTREEYEFVGHEKYRQIAKHKTGEVETRWKRKDGKIIDVLLSSTSVDADDLSKGVTFTALDITERKEAEVKLAESEARYRNILEVAPVGIAIHQNEKIVFVNPEGLRIIGANSSEQIIGKEITKIIHPDNLNELRNRTQRLKNGEQGIYPAEDKYIRLDGEVVDVEVVATFLTYNNEPAVQVIITDITDRKKMLNELIAAKEKAEESDRLKSAFLANMSHEIRTPMNGILGFADLLKEPGLTGEKQQKYITIIENSGVRMLNIINDIMDISRIEAGVMEIDLSESNINEQLDYIYSFFKPQVEAKGMHLILSEVLHQGQEKIITDQEKLFAVLTNLVKNAIRYTHEGIIEFGCHKKGSALEFFVRDTGIGIHKDRQQAIFDRFVQADIEDIRANQGAGLGLAISKAYVEMLEGEIWVESEKDKGSTFYFTLPYKTVPAAETIDRQLVPSEKTDAVRKLKILIVEDDEVSEVLLDETVNMFGKEILKARTGVEALEVCRDNPDTDLIFMDIRLPDMGGYEATKQIRAFNKEVVIIAQTAYGLTGDREKAIESGCNDYIAKPIKKSELQALTQKYFGK